ncbi:MAG TPA: proline dehydrogenase family protein [Chitinophagales bacterium]|jgi:proline dehydrogenase|nr:proline dehydrogenase family protein [Chitinophagales bacterium]MBP6153397.1 proline dehydrogenase family protein [Chitinophagales bacterium]HQV79124.1 proline dehydrogenase family protein [Chitinophagales bacterium]HQW79920.1 proline dehydrogenase family protein [Chitinophagales bacterium]HRB67506.1 proline dehydrogenase family protein [Chitinophagales bacterium]
MDNLNFNNTQTAFAYKSNSELLRDYRIFQLINQSWLVKYGTQVAASLIQFGIKTPVAMGMKPTVYATFCGGNNLNEASSKINKLERYHVRTVLDYGVEGKEREEDFQRTESAIKQAILFAKDKDAVHIVSSKFTGLIPFSILEKLHAKNTLSDEENSIYEKSKSRINSIAQLAFENDISLFVDAEETWIQQPLDDLTYELMLKYNKEKPIIYNTIQLYRKDRLDVLKKYIKQAQSDNIIYAVKLVRGAYMEKEAARALTLNYENPIQSSKENTDNDYNEALKVAVKNIKNTAICVATHNEESSILATQLMQAYQLPNNHEHIQFSQLFGMSDNITFNLGLAGYNVHKYMPYGPVKDVIPYLIRRAQENTSVSGQMGRELKLLKEEVKRRKLSLIF